MDMDSSRWRRHTLLQPQDLRLSHRISSHELRVPKTWNWRGTCGQYGVIFQEHRPPCWLSLSLSLSFTLIDSIALRISQTYRCLIFPLSLSPNFQSHHAQVRIRTLYLGGCVISGPRVHRRKTHRERREATGRCQSATHTVRRPSSTL